MREAERAAGRDDARADRAERAVRAAADIGALMLSVARKGTDAWGTPAQLTRLLARTTASLVDPDETRGADAPHGDDWRAIVEEFKGSHPPRPRLFAEYADAESGRPTRPLLPHASPPLGYAIHLLNCARCRAAEASRTPVACPVHVWCAMMEGLRPVPGPDGPPSRRPPGPPALPSHGPVTSADAEALRVELAAEVELGTLRRLTAAEGADPDVCAQVCGMHVVSKNERTLPATLAGMGSERLMDVQAVAEAAQEAGGKEAAAYLVAAAGLTPTMASARAAMSAAFDAALALHRKPGGKMRPVPHLNKTANSWSIPVGTTFPSAADLAGGAPPGSSMFTMDATKAYRAIRLDPAAAAQQVMCDPATGDIYAPTGGVWGSNSVGAAYCGVTALIKEAVRGRGPSWVEGSDQGPATAAELEACARSSPALAAVLADLCRLRTPAILLAQQQHAIVATGTADDIGCRAPAGVIVELHTWTRDLARRVGYTENVAKGQTGPCLTFTGMAVDLTGDAPVLTVRVQKLYAFYADMALIAAVARAGGLVPTAWLRSAAGLMEWAASADAGVKLRRGGVRAALCAAEARGYDFASVGRTYTAGAAAAGMLARACRGDARPARMFRASAIWSAAAVSYEETLHGLQALTITAPGVTGISYDASLAEGMVTTGAICGRAAVHRRFRARKGESSMSAELAALRAAAVVHFPLHAGSTVIAVGDSLSAAYAVNRARADYGTRAWEELEVILTLAELYSITLFAIWLPRTANTSTDALSNCRTDQAAHDWAERCGRTLG